MAAMSFTRSPTLVFLRIRVVAGLASGVGALAAGTLFLGAVFLHSRAVGIAALVALAISLLALAVTEGWRAFLLFDTGRWTTLGGRPTSRSEHPAMFATWVTVHGLFAAINSGAAGYMIWIAISSSR